MNSACTPPNSFDAPDLFNWLEAAALPELDCLAFGLIGMAADYTVQLYNLAEGKMAGLTPARVIGRHFFTSVAICMNNFMIAHRFETEPEIDAVIDYVLTFRVAPVKVRLRLMKRPGAKFMYVAIDRR
jgi:photoactive yellow protein